MKTDDIFTAVAEKELHIKTLATRHSDGLDFHDVAVWQVRNAFDRLWRIRDYEVRLLQSRIKTLEADLRKKKRAERS